MSDNNTDIANAYTTDTSVRHDQWRVTQTGLTLDCRDHEVAITSILTVGEAEGTSETVAVAIHESADDSSFAAITGAAHTTTTAGAGHTTEVITFFNRSLRYVRAVATVAGTSPDIDFAVVLMARKKSY